MQNSEWGELSAQIEERDRSLSDKDEQKSKTNDEVFETAKEKLDEKSVNWDELGAKLDQLDGASTMNVDKSLKKKVIQENIADGPSRPDGPSDLMDRPTSQVNSNIIIAKKETQLKNNSTDEKLNEKSGFNENISKMGFQIDIW